METTGHGMKMNNKITFMVAMAECKMLSIGESNIEINEHKLMLVFLNHSQENYSHQAGFLDYQELDCQLHLEINPD